MSTPDNARQGHAVLSVVLSTLALGVLLASAVMGWWMRGRDDGSMTGPPTQVVDAGSSHG